MLKFKGTENGKILIGFGLSLENITLLQQGHPILFDADNLGIKDTKITIFYGRTEDEMLQDFRKAGALKL